MKPAKNTIRARKARKDATVGALKRTIEDLLGLPKGSLRLAVPNGRNMRSDATVQTLRRRWGP